MSAMEAQDDAHEPKIGNHSNDVGALIVAMEALEEAVRCREQKVEDLTQQTRSARSRASSAKENQRSYVTELVCAEEKLSVKKESLRVLQEKRQQLTDELAELQNAEANTRKQLNLCREKFAEELEIKTLQLRERCKREQETTQVGTEE